MAPPKPEFYDTWDDQDDYAESSDDSFDSDPQKLSEDQSYREHVKAVRHFMGWQVPDVDPPIKEPSNPLWTLTSPLAGRISVCFPVDQFVVEQMKKLNRTVTLNTVRGLRTVYTVRRFQCEFILLFLCFLL